MQYLFYQISKIYDETHAISNPVFQTMQRSNLMNGKSRDKLVRFDSTKYLMTHCLVGAYQQIKNT